MLVFTVACLQIFMHVFAFILQAEIEKVKKRREERAIEKAQHEEEMVSLVLCTFKQLLVGSVKEDK